MAAESSCSPGDDESESSASKFGERPGFPSRPKYPWSAACPSKTSSGVSDASSQSDAKEKFVAGVDESDRSADSAWVACGDDGAEDPGDAEKVPVGLE